MITRNGLRYYHDCKQANRKCDFKPREHYQAIPRQDRLLMPCGSMEERSDNNLLAMYCGCTDPSIFFFNELGNLRHIWCWKKRNRPCVPFWNKQPVPHPKKSEEENCRLLSIYFRPWCLHATMRTVTLPLLAELSDESNKYKPCFQSYVQGGTVSGENRRYIQNAMLQAIGSPFHATAESSDDDSEPEQISSGPHVGNMEHVSHFLNPLDASTAKDVNKQIHKHLASINAATDRWKTEPLPHDTL